MEYKKIEEVFGKDKAKLYLFVGEIPSDKSPAVHITDAFVAAAGSNLATSVVSNVQKSWMLYTKEDVDISNDSNFRFLVEFPLPEPEPRLDVLDSDSDSSAGV